jgi:hypothetical protein
MAFRPPMADLTSYVAAGTVISIVPVVAESTPIKSWYVPAAGKVKSTA